jgi:hypothetical protein
MTIQIASVCHDSCACTLQDQLGRMLKLSGITESVQGYNLDAKYAVFNQRFFKGELPTIPVTWGKMKTMGGVAKAQITQPKNASRSGGKFAGASIVPGSMAIQISDIYKRSEEGLDGILLHEMIHILCYVEGRFDENHGPYFRKVAASIGTSIGFEIPLTDDVTNLSLATAKAKPVGVILMQKQGGGYAYALVGANALGVGAQEAGGEMWGRMDKSYVAALRGYVVASDLWTLTATRMPVQRSLKGLKYYRLDKSEISDELLRDLDGFGKLLFYFDG